MNSCFRHFHQIEFTASEIDLLSPKLYSHAILLLLLFITYKGKMLHTINVSIRRKNNIFSAQKHDFLHRLVTKLIKRDDMDTICNQKMLRDSVSVMVEAGVSFSIEWLLCEAQKIAKKNCLH